MREGRRTNSLEPTMSARRPKPTGPEKPTTPSQAVTPTAGSAASGSGLLPELRELILTTRQTVARGVNAALTVLYWQVGDRIRRDILQEARAGYGEEIVSTLSRQLTPEFGRGFSEKALRHMVRFAEAFPDFQIVSTLSRQLAWSHYKEIIYLKDELQRDFYAEMCRLEGWSVRTLRAKIGGMLYERTALSRKPEELIRQELDTLRESDKLTPDLVFKDPYFLDFLGLRDTYSERDLETAILREIERFLLEMGAGFAFVERQKRIVVDGEDFYLDLLFFHRRLRRLVLVELKLEAFRPADFGQTTLYLRWLDRYERQPGEEPPHPPAVGTRADPVRREVRRARRAAGAGEDGHPGGGIPDRAAAESGAAGAASRGRGARSGATGAARGGPGMMDGMPGLSGPVVRLWGQCPHDP
jgi:predicted nuclease of restriction endonuclease-like (RecB) superfamily